MFKPLKYEDRLKGAGVNDPPLRKCANSLKHEVV
jgi:hypothetical protein